MPHTQRRKKVKFIEKQSQYPNKRRLIKVNENNQPLNEAPILVNIEKDEGEISVMGTPINAENLNKGNWRDDKSLSFKVQTENDEPITAKPDEIQIFTTCTGKTMLMPAGENLEPVEIGKTVGTTVIENGIGKETWNADTKVSIADLVNNLNETAAGKALDARQGKILDEKKLDKTALLDLIYPIGSIYMSVVKKSPATFLGGNWVPYAEGRVLVGIGDNGETNYDVPEIPGGKENSVATHSHSAANTMATNNNTTATNHPVGDHQHRTAQDGQWQTTGSSGQDGLRTGSGTNAPLTGWGGGHSHGQDAHSHTQNAHTHTIGNAGEAGGNRMPFITCYMWKRIAEVN
jgi:hypothetical protein